MWITENTIGGNNGSSKQGVASRGRSSRAERWRWWNTCLIPTIRVEMKWFPSCWMNDGLRRNAVMRWVSTSRRSSASRPRIVRRFVNGAEGLVNASTPAREKLARHSPMKLGDGSCFNAVDWMRRSVQWCWPARKVSWSSTPWPCRCAPTIQTLSCHDASQRQVHIWWNLEES